MDFVFNSPTRIGTNVNKQICNHISLSLSKCGWEHNCIAILYTVYSFSFMKTSKVLFFLPQSMQIINCENDKATLPVQVEIKIRENVFLRSFHHSVKKQLHFSEN